MRSWRTDGLELSNLAVREGRTRAAVADDRIVGFATWLGTGNIVEIEDLFVDPERMRVEVTANQHALAFCEKAGFVVDYEVATMFRPASRMHMDLTSTGDGA